MAAVSPTAWGPVLRELPPPSATQRIVRAGIRTEILPRGRRDVEGDFPAAGSSSTLLPSCVRLFQKCPIAGWMQWPAWACPSSWASPVVVVAIPQPRRPGRARGISKE